MLILLGCVPAATPARPGPPRTIVLDVRSRLPWPFALEKTRVAIDGVVAPPSPFLAEEGMHTVAFLADVSMPCSAFSSHRIRLRVRAAHTFTIEHPPAVVGIELYSRDFTAPPEDQLRVRFILRGASAGGTRYWPPPARCTGLDDAAHAICFVESIVEQARKDRDIILLTCANEKLKLMQATTDIVRIKKLMREATECVGEELMYVESIEVTFEDNCGASIDSFSEPRDEAPIRVPPLDSSILPRR